jgi:hypothetical protein
VFDDHRSCQKLINYITNIKAKIKTISLDPENSSPKAAVHTKLCKRSRCLEENPVFLFLLKKKIKKKNSPQVCK